MNRIKEMQIGNLQDCWSILYMEMAKALLEADPMEGEAALREAVRRYGRERGEKLRCRHKESGLKINLENLFTYYDLPGDPRFRRRKIRLNPQERLSDTLICPIAELWEQSGEKKLGRIYCEEFHHAMFGAYAKKAQIDLAKTLTQEGDHYCCFAVYLRPANMSAEERKEAFAEFDKEYKLPEDFSYDEGTHKKGFQMLAVRFLYHMIDTAVEYMGDKGEEAARKGLMNLASSYYRFLKEKNQEMEVPFDAAFLEENCPLSTHMSDDDLWEEYVDEKVKKIADEAFYQKFDGMF